MGIFKFLIKHGPGSIGHNAEVLAKMFADLKKECPDLPRKELFKELLKRRTSGPYKLLIRLDLGDKEIEELIEKSRGKLSKLILELSHLERPSLDNLAIDDSDQYSDVAAAIREMVNKYAPEGDSDIEQSNLLNSIPKKEKGVDVSFEDLTITIPLPFREKFPTKDIVITRNIDGCLLVFEKEEWKNFLEHLKNLHSTKAFSRYSLRFVRLMVSGIVETRIGEDWKIIIPDYLKEYAKLDNSVVLIDIGRALEIWNREELEKSRKS